jgi:hypothetical protein
VRTPQVQRLGRIELQQSNFKATTTARIYNLEERVFEIEKKLLSGK